jgi:hypothetical protein
VHQARHHLDTDMSIYVVFVMMERGFVHLFLSNCTVVSSMNFTSLHVYF